MDNDLKMYDTYIGLYKFYWDLVLKLLIFTLGLSGAVASYVIKNQEVPYMEIVLIIPVMLALSLAVLAHLSESSLKYMSDDIEKISNRLELSSIIKFDSLMKFTSISKFIFSLVGIGQLVLLAKLA